MEKLVLSLAPAFAAGFAVQQLIELVDSIFGPILKWDQPNTPINKKALFGIISLGVGLLIAFFSGIRVLQPLGVPQAGVMDVLVTGLVISAGTEGINSIMKFLGYTKDAKKDEATTAGANASLNAPGQTR